MARALITNSRVVVQQGNKGENLYHVDIEFQYTLQGQKYTTRATSGYVSSSEREMQLQAGYYTPGTYRIIRYNPANPGNIRLAGSDNVGFFFLAAVLGVCGLGLAFFGTLFAVISGAARKHVCEACLSEIGQEDGCCPACGESYDA